ncbi:hypothetical protein D7V97_40465, partial [Corallococcus sp. CA053C]
RVGVPAEAAGADGVVCGGEGQPRHVAGGGSELGRGQPRYVERDFAKYLECGGLAHGFARVRCERCKEELLVAFSCKGRGVCPSCNAKRAHVTAAHQVERVLPHVAYRQCSTQSAPA